jgi:hypothetical protein
MVFIPNDSFIYGTPVVIQPIKSILLYSHLFGCHATRHVLKELRLQLVVKPKNFPAEKLWLRTQKYHIICRQASEGRMWLHIYQQITSSHHFVTIKESTFGYEGGVHYVIRPKKRRKALVTEV